MTQAPIASPSGCHSVAIALGSNIGDSHAILDAALELLDQTPGIRLITQSHHYQTIAIGPPQPDIINACALLSTSLLPNVLLRTMLAIEARFGRVRRERWGPRTLDLDLLLYDDWIIDVPGLTVPHPRMNGRAFVLVPLAEIAADWIEPISGKAIADLVQTVDCFGVQRCGLD